MKNKTNYFELTIPDISAELYQFALRDGEVKLGERVVFRSETEDWKQCRYHILGVQEDVGPQLNGGLPGAKNAFQSFIGRFLSLQANRFIQGEAIAIHGTISFIGSDQASSDMIDDLDDMITEWVLSVVESGGIPIVIGGGHNNAYGLIKAASHLGEKPLSVVNLDPHADTRSMEFRHSGNPFSYAFTAGYLQQYTVLGLHESYNNETILNFLTQMKAQVFYYESWLDNVSQFEIDVNQVATDSLDKPTGVELDMDAIAYMPASAFTPSGISVDQARIYVRKMARNQKVAYLHLPEAAPKNETEEKITGKALAYLVSDFIKVNQKK
ncbi:MAG: arginase family protein [Fluviicola sp.]|nr:arginase family protein [Fluviicola sp.]